MNTAMDQCEFCDEFRGGTRNSFAARYIDRLKDRTILETGHLKLLPSLGHFVKGYLLIVPKRHYCALGDAPLETLRQVEEIKIELSRRLGPIYGRYTFFEHGTRGPGSGGCGIDHAHLHALPLSIRTVLSRLKGEFSYRSIASLCALRRATGSASYLYCEDSARQSWLFFPSFLPSQYMRRLTAEASGILEWDWRESGREDAFLATRVESLKALSGVCRGR
jgi:diadenosine tetraphosphate (Ap4A) HIT family hydrolase